MNETTQSHDLRCLATDREWYGYLTLENAAAVGERIRKLLAGQRYTWVACNEMGGYRPEVRTGQRMEKLTVRNENGFASVNVVDTYGVWGIHADVADQRAAYKCVDQERKRLTYLHLQRDRIEVDHYAIAGNHLWWAAVVEPRAEVPDDPERAKQVRTAISDPGSLTDRERGFGLDQDEPESLPQWQTRAVLTVIAPWLAAGESRA